MVIDRRDSVISRCLQKYGEFAEGENKVMSRLVHAGDTVLDVGSNLGTVTLALSHQVGQHGRVFAVDAQTLMCEYLRQTLALNDLHNVQVLNAAMGAREGSVNLTDIEYDQGGNFGALSLEGIERGNIKMRTIDSLGLKQCSLIKIDVEGMELDVLGGAASTMSKHQPAVYVENKDKNKSTELIKFFFDRNYTLYWHFARFVRNKNFLEQPVSDFNNVGDINTVCVPPGRNVKYNLPKISSPASDWREELDAWRRKQNS